MKNLIILLAFIALCLFSVFFLGLIHNKEASSILTEQTNTQTQGNIESIPSGRMINIRPKLIGKWQSDEDQKYVMEITLTQKIDLYEGKESSRELYELNPSPDDRGWILSIKEDGVDMSYRVIDVSDTKLELEYIGRGNTLSFTKVLN